MNAIFSLSVILILLFLVLFVTDNIWTTEVEMNGEILNLTYSPGKTSTTTGVAVTPNGSGGVSTSPIVGVTTSDDEWIVTVRSGNDIYHVKTSEQRFYELKVSDDIKFVAHYGKISGWFNGAYTK